MLAVKLLCDELIESDRHICTNLPLRLDALQEWLIKKTGSADAMRRLRILTDSECMQFWLHYGVGYDIQGRVTIKDGDRTKTMPDFGARFRDGRTFPGTLYIIDELHIFFPSRAWAKTGDDALDYQSQHRGLGDDCILMSQHPEQCDKAMRRLCQDFTYLTNLGKTKLMGFTFKGFGRRATFAKETDPQPIETGTYRLPIAEYGGLYDTNAKAGGIVGRIDIKEKGGGGRNPLLIPVYVVVILLACWFLPKLLFAGVGTMARQAASGLSTVTHGATNAMQRMSSHLATNAVPHVMVGPTLPVLPITPSITAVKSPDTNKLTISRRVILGHKRTYWLSDGRKVSQGDGDVLVAQEDYIILQGGKVVWFDK